MDIAFFDLFCLPRLVWAKLVAVRPAARILRMPVFKRTPRTSGPHPAPKECFSAQPSLIQLQKSAVLPSRASSNLKRVLFCPAEPHPTPKECFSTQPSLVQPQKSSVLPRSSASSLRDLKITLKKLS